MNQLVTVKTIKGVQDVFTDSLIIAKGTKNQHDSVLNMINKYLKDFEKLGEVKFTDLKSENPLGGRPMKLCVLNEQQATFLMTLLRNNTVTVAFKLRLVQEFYLMREFNSALALLELLVNFLNHQPNK